MKLKKENDRLKNKIEKLTKKVKVISKTKDDISRFFYSTHCIDDNVLMFVLASL